jgi:hypothetical protein
MGFTRRTSGAVGVWVVFLMCGVHQAVAGGDPPSPAVPVKADAAVAAPAAPPTSATTVTEGAAPVAMPAATTTETEGAARVPAVVMKPTPHRNSLEDPVLTNDEVKRLLSQGYTQEKMSNGDIQYCRKEASVGSMISKRRCVTGGQLKMMAEDKRQFNDLVQQKAGANPRPSSPD